MLQDFITSALIIDDKVEEIELLKKYLEELDIWVKHYTPKELDDIQITFNNRKLIFLDLYLDENSSSLEGNLSKIRSFFSKILGVNFGAYGIVLFTKHNDEFEAFVERIYKTGGKYTPPLFVVSVDKNKYLQQNDYSSILKDLDENLFMDVASSFFVEWNKAVKLGSDNTITSLYDLFDSYEKKNKHLEAILYKLACNYSGIPDGDKHKNELQKDLIKSLMDSLQFEIFNSYQEINNLFSIEENLLYNVDKEEKENVFGKLNSLLLLDFHNNLQHIVIPGNIYEVIKTDDSIYFNSFFNNKGEEIKLDDHEDFKEMDDNNKMIGNKVNKRIIIEVTPPCDFASKKKQHQSRIVGGILINYDENLKNKYFKGGSFYSSLSPIYFEGLPKPQMIIFDFYRFQTIKEEILKNESQYVLIMKAKSKLFADILQKLSAHTARLGIAILSPK